MIKIECRQIERDVKDTMQNNKGIEFLIVISNIGSNFNPVTMVH